MSSMTRQDKIDTLERRLNYLHRKLESKDYSEASANYMKAEVAALKWVLDICYAIQYEVDLRDETVSTLQD